MKYLIPALGIFVTTTICKYSGFIQQNFMGNLKAICKLLMTPEVRMETVALSIASTLFERIEECDLVFLKDVLMTIFQSLHFYRNNTKSKTIPGAIMKAVHLFFANFMIQHGS